MSAPGEFRLTPPEPKPPKRTRTRAQIQAEAAARKAAKAAEVDAAKAQRNADFEAVKKAYFDAFRRGRGELPLFGGAEGRAVHTLLDKLGSVKAAIDIFENVYADAFLSRPGGATIRAIASDPDRFKGTPKRRHGTHLQEEHPGPTRDWLPDESYE